MLTACQPLNLSVRPSQYVRRCLILQFCTPGIVRRNLFNVSPCFPAGAAYSTPLDASQTTFQHLNDRGEQLGVSVPAHREFLFLKITALRVLTP